MVRRILAIANALDGMSREEAARSAGMDRQTLRDWVVRYNEHGIDGLADRWGDGRPPTFDGQEQAELMRIVLDGPDPEASGLSAYTLEDLANICEQRFGKRMHPWSLGRLLKRLGFSRQKTRPSHPQKDPAAQAAFKRAPALLRKIQHTHKNKRIRLFFQDEARIGQKGRTCHIWWRRGERPPGLCDKRFTFAYIFAAVEPGTDNAFALVMPYVNTEAMQVFLDRFAATIGDDEHVAMVLDQAGWHASGALRISVSADAVLAVSPLLFGAAVTAGEPAVRQDQTRSSHGERTFLGRFQLIADFVAEGFLSAVQCPFHTPRRSGIRLLQEPAFPALARSPSAGGTVDSH